MQAETLDLPTEASSRRLVVPGEDTRHKTAEGLYQESTLMLSAVKFGGEERTSVFIYPASYLNFGLSALQTLDPRFSVARAIRGKTFRNASVEDVNTEFLKLIHPLLSDMTYNYPVTEPRVIEQTFTPKACFYLEEVVNELEIG